MYVGVRLNNGPFRPVCLLAEELLPKQVKKIGRFSSRKQDRKSKESELKNVNSRKISLFDWHQLPNERVRAVFAMFWLFKNMFTDNNIFYEFKVVLPNG